MSAPWIGRAVEVDGRSGRPGWSVEVRRIAGSQLQIEQARSARTMEGHHVRGARVPAHAHPECVVEVERG